MRLTELKPRWTGYPKLHMGLTFLCPHCLDQRIGVSFWPWITLEGCPKLENLNQPEDKTKLWTWCGGESFDNITLNPSVNVEMFGHWHGFIINGETK